MRVPGLHVLTNDAVLGAPWFRDRSRRLIESHGPSLALHLRGPGTAPARLLELATALQPLAAGAGALLLINDRADVALAAGVDGVQLGARSLPVSAARALRPDWRIGASVHGVAEALAAEGADFLVLGTIWKSQSHPGRDGAGLALVRSVVEGADVPVLAVGGVTPRRAAAALGAGGSGVAVLRGVWDHDDAAGAAAEYLSCMERAGEDA
jgi:thiamine-phosphate diphosphorylase